MIKILLLMLGFNVCVWLFVMWLDQFISKHNRSVFKQKFKDEIDTTAKSLIFKKDDYLKEVKNRCTEQENILLAAERKLTEKRIEIEKEYEDLIKKREEEIKLLDLKFLTFQEQREQVNLEQIEKLTLEQQNNLKVLENDYLLQKEDLTNAITQLNISLNAEKEQLNKTLNEIQRDRAAIIEHFKEQEKLREENNFYRLQLTQDNLSDIIILKDMAKKLNNPTILYKLIWENYYKAAYNQLVGRVIPQTQCGIYKITEIESQKVYIGQSVDIKGRWRTHCRRGIKAEIGTANKLYENLFEIGLENFTFEVVEVVERNRLTERENFWIEFYDSKNWGFNSKK